MPANRVDAGNDTQTSTSINVDKKRPTWKDLVGTEVKTNELISVTCHAYSAKDRETVDQSNVCPCGRLMRSHSFDGMAKPQKSKTFGQKFLSQQKLTVYGQLTNEARVRNTLILISTS